ncbi:MAG: hypothetical protein M3O31_17750 [Acidobacteriota bacterium]|nr:hypothetical protein [Acidobacteriota bacterium]
MNWMVRNVTALLCGALTSSLVVAILLYYEARDGSVLFSYNGQTLIGFPFLAWIPLGPIAAGMAGAIGYLGGALALRLRPASIALFVVISVAGFMVFAAQSAEFALFIQGWPQPNGGPTKNMATYCRFLGKSIAHTPLNFWGGDEYSSYSSEDVSAFFRPGGTSPSAAPQLGQSGDSRVDGLGGGVSGVMQSQDMSQTETGKKIGQFGQFVNSVRARIKSHGSEWMRLFLQTMGFSMGGLMVMIYLRKVPFCKDCMLLLKKKGSNARYYSRSRDMRLAVDEVLYKARDKQLQQAIHAQVSKGADHDGSWSEYSSVMEIRRCVGCRLHMMRFRTRRKSEERWNDIDLLGYTTTSLEPLDFA